MLRVALIGSDRMLFELAAEHLDIPMEFVSANSPSQYDRIGDDDRGPLEKLRDPHAVGTSTHLLATRDAAKDADLIVIQNNMGAGVDRVKAVTEANRDKVVIISTSELSERDRKPYKDLGVTQFVTHDYDTLTQFLRHLKADE